MARAVPHGDITYTRPWLADYQLAALFCPERYSLIEASTKAGKTVSALVWIVEQAMQGQAGRNYWWVAPVRSQAAIAFRRLRRMVPRDLVTVREVEMTLTLANGATLWFKSGEQPENLYGEDVYAAVIDEASHVREEAFHALRSTLTATKGPVRIIGNCRGRQNWFYRMSRRAEAGEPDMHYARITWRDAVAAGILEEAEIEDARRQLPAAVFQQLYAAVAADDEGNPFGLDAIRQAVAPQSTAPAVAAGWDLAKSVDWTVGVGLDEQGATSWYHRWQSPWGETLNRIRLHTGTTPALVDATGVGDPIVETLQRGSRNFEGLVFTSSSKQALMEGLAMALQQGTLHIVAEAVPEFEAFEYHFTRGGVRYSAPEGMHDDIVCAYGLAVSKLTRRQSSRPRFFVA